VKDGTRYVSAKKIKATDSSESLLSRAKEKETVMFVLILSLTRVQ
jgi:hypothetical protein